jgi:O-antigen biosynthesis protein
VTLCSVITPTWERHQLLLERCIPSVQVQTWPDVEHVVVSDGPDDRLAAVLAGYDVVYGELPEHPNDDCNFGAYSRNHGLTLATGELIAYLDDDNAFRPEHVETLANALLNSDAEFAYSQMLRHPAEDTVGRTPPAHGSVDSSILMHRRDTPDKFGLWPIPSPYAVDWELVKNWLERGATWVHVPRVTVDYWLRDDG